MDALDNAAVSYQLVLDQGRQAQDPTEIEAIARRHQRPRSPSARPRTPSSRATSAETGMGIDLLRADIAALA